MINMAMTRVLISWNIRTWKKKYMRYKQHRLVRPYPQRNVFDAKRDML